MKLTESQQTRLQELAHESYADDFPEVEWEPRRQKLLGEISDPLELHSFAMNANWDCGTEDLEWVLDHKYCDVGTALMIYALGSPGYFYRKQEKGEQFSDGESEAWMFLKSIEQRVHAGAFTHGKVAFNPRDFGNCDHFQINSANPGNRLVPKFMQNPTRGEIIENATT